MTGRRSEKGRRPRIVVSLLAVALAAAVAAAPAAAEPSEVPQVGERKIGSPAKVDDYWTPNRMRNAKPADIEVVDGEPQQRQDEPVPTVAPIPYESFELTDTTSYPNRVHGKVFFSKPGEGNFVCSGTVVQSSNDSTVITAGHCANDSGVWSTNFVFVPGYRNGQAPYGTWPASALLATQQWVQAENLRYDIAAAVIARNEAGQELEDVVGARGIAFNQPANQLYLSHGYPAAWPFDGSRLWACESQFGWFDTGLPGTGPPTMAIGCNMTGGSSGGGWVVNGNLLSLNSYKYLSQADVMYGPYFDSTAQNLFNQAQTGAPGSTAPATNPPPPPPPAAQPAPLTVTKCKTVTKKAKKKSAKKRAGKSGKRKKKKAKRVCWQVRV